MPTAKDLTPGTQVGATDPQTGKHFYGQIIRPARRQPHEPTGRYEVLGAAGTLKIIHMDRLTIHDPEQTRRNWAALGISS